MGRTGRPKVEIRVTEDERVDLQRLARRSRTNRHVALRAKLILASADGHADTAIATQYRVHRRTVGTWRRRFAELRLEGLHDEPRVGAPRRITDEKVEQVLVKRWLARHPYFHLHFTPTYASWLNLVERFFALLTQEALSRASHTSIPQLRAAISEYVEVHNEEGKPFVWTKTADALLDKVLEFGQRTLQVHAD